jgi:hypothetical protein
MAWDDDTVPELEMDPSSDRVTAVPELPSEVLAKRLMAEALDEPVSGTFERNEEGAELLGDTPPLASTAPPPGRREPPIVRDLSPPEEPRLEIDESALDSAVAARGRWQRPVANVTDPPPRSLELDLSALERSAPPEPERSVPPEPERSVPPEPERSAPPPDPVLSELQDRYAMGDYSGALVVAEGMLDNDPGNVEALRFAKSCREVLTGMYSARLGALDQVVTVGVPGEQIRWLSLDHRAGFLLSLVDGALTLEEILDISGMPRLDALRIMFSLLQEGVITLPSRG